MATAATRRTRARGPEPSVSLEAKICPICRQHCRSTRVLNKHVKEVHSGMKFCCSKCPRIYKTKSNKVNHEKNCTFAPPSLAQRLHSPRPAPQSPAHKLEDNTAKDMVVSDNWDREDSAANSREKADGSYSHQYTDRFDKRRALRDVDGTSSTRPKAPGWSVLTRRMSRSGPARKTKPPIAPMGSGKKGTPWPPATTASRRTPQGGTPITPATREASRGPQEGTCRRSRRLQERGVTMQQHQPAKKPHPHRDLNEEKGPQLPGHGRARHPRPQPRPKEAPHSSRPPTCRTVSSTTHPKPCKQKGGAG